MADITEKGRSVVVFDFPVKNNFLPILCCILVFVSIFVSAWFYYKSEKASADEKFKSLDKRIHDLENNGTSVVTAF